MANFILPTIEEDEFVLPEIKTTGFKLPEIREIQFKLPDISQQQFALPGTKPYFGQMYRPRDIEDREFKGFVWKLLGDYMQRGNFMAANVADAILRKDNDLLGAAWRGLKGEDKRYFSDVLSGMGANNTTATILGLALDIGLDPATYVPFGVFLKAGTKTLKGTKAFKATTKVAEATWVGKKFMAAQNSLIKLFTPGEGAPKALYELKKYLGKESKWEQVKAIKKIAGWQTDIPKEVGEMMSKVRAGKLAPDMLNPKQLKAFEKVTGELKILGKQAVDLKLITKEAFEKHMNDYIYGFYEGKTKIGSLSGLSGAAPFRKTKSWDTPVDAYDYLVSMKKKMASAKTIQQAREVAMAEAPNGWKLGSRGAIERLTLKELKSTAAKVPLPEMNLFKSTAIREVTQIRETYRIKFVRQALDKWGREIPLASKLKEIPEGMSVYIPRSLVDDLIYKTEDDIGKALVAMDKSANVQGELLKLTPDLAKGLDKKLLKLGKDVPKKYLLNDEYAEYLNKLYVGFNPGTQEFRKLLTNFYDPVLMTWKGIVTAMRPTFHIRNFTSNLFLSWLGGVDAANLPIRHWQGIKLAKSLKKKGASKGFIKTKNLGKFSYQQLEELAQKTGAAGSGWMGADKPHEVWDTLMTAFRKGRRPLKEAINPIQYGRAFGTAIEDASRRALFVDSIIKSNKTTLAEAGIEAAEKVAKFLFDYGELCFDKETEVLTNKGWKKWFEIKDNLKVLSFNLKKDCLEWKDINYIYIKDFDGKLNHWHSNRFDAMITDDHKWVVYGDMAKKGNHNVIERDKYSLVKTGKAKRKLKVVSQNYNNPIKEKIFSNNFVELIGWVLTEGNYSCVGKSLQIYQSVVNKDKVDRLRDCWKKIQGEYKGTFTEYVFKRENNIHSFYIGRDLAHKIIDMFPDKQLTVDFLLKLTNEQLKILYEVMMITDGTKHCKSGHETFTQKGDAFAGAFQILLFLIGKRSNSKKEEKNGSIYNRVSVYTSKNIYVRNLKKERIRYKDKIWCVNSDNQTLVARRNGTVYLTGNSSFERKTMKRILPFYTWARKNVPLQFSQILEQPRKYAKLGKFREFAEGFAKETKEEAKFTPEWMQEVGFIKSPWKKGGKPLYFYTDLPIKDLDYLWNVRDIVSGMSPLIKFPIEYFYGVKTFPTPGEPISKPGKEYTYAPGWMAILPEKIREHLGLKKTYDRLAGQEVVKISKLALYTLETILPMTRDLNMFYPQPIQLLQDKSLSRMLAYPTGMQWKILDVAQEQRNMIYEANQLRREITMHFKETGEISQDKQNRLNEIIMIFSKK